jgi:hypothetical protein
MLTYDVVAGCWKIEEDIRGRMFPYGCGLYLKELAGLKRLKKLSSIEPSCRKCISWEC